MAEMSVPRPAAPTTVESGTQRAPTEGKSRGRRRAPATAPTKPDAKKTPADKPSPAPTTPDDGHHIDVLI
jgi:hypothetical protein